MRNVLINNGYKAIVTLYGYEVVNPEGESVYFAGNCIWESTKVVHPNSDSAVGAAQLMRFAKETLDEIVAEENA